jgi:hypothetical protein
MRWLIPEISTTYKNITKLDSEQLIKAISEGYAVYFPNNFYILYSGFIDGKNEIKMAPCRIMGKIKI